MPAEHVLIFILLLILALLCAMAVGIAIERRDVPMVFMYLTKTAFACGAALFVVFG